MARPGKTNLKATVVQSKKYQLQVYRVGAALGDAPVGYVSEKLVRSVALNALCEKYESFENG